MTLRPMNSMSVSPSMRGQRSSLLLLALMLMTVCQRAMAQVPFPDTCPDVKVVDVFDLDRYMGIWYEYSKYPFFWEAGQKCQYAIYKNNGNDTVAVKNVGTFVIVNKVSSVEGTAKVIAPGQLAVAFKNRKLSSDEVVDEPNYLILGTDYDNWVVVYSCRSIGSVAHTKIIWILTRQRQPSEESIRAAMRVIADNQLNESFLLKTIQTDCPDSEDNNSSADDQITSASSVMDAQSDLDLSTLTTASNILETA